MYMSEILPSFGAVSLLLRTCKVDWKL